MAGSQMPLLSFLAGSSKLGKTGHNQKKFGRSLKNSGRSLAKLGRIQRKQGCSQPDSGHNLTR